MDDWIFIKLIHKVHINNSLIVIQGQGHKVKGQGQMYNYIKNFYFISLAYH